MSGLVLVTGSARRVGAAIAKRLTHDGWTIGLHCNASRDEAGRVAAEITSAGGASEIFQANLRDEASASAMCDALAARGDWVGLVNSAASFEQDDIETFAFDAATTQLSLNLVAPVYLARRLHQALPQTARGFVVNISDQKVFNPNPDFLSYTLSKLGLTQATAPLAMALAPRIRVNCVAAGLMLRSGDQTEENFARVHAQTLTQRGTQPEDVADAVAYLARAENVTGAILTVDGGQHLVPSARDVMFS